MKENDSHGSGGWAKRADLHTLLVPKEQRPAPGALLIGPSPYPSWWRGSERVELPKPLACGHVAIIGAPGSGKGRGFFLWNCAHYQGSFLYADPKSEGWELTSGYRKKAIRYAPTEPDKSACFNWIPACKDDPQLGLLLARAMVSATDNGHGNPFFTDADAFVLSALFAHTATFANPTPAAMWDFVTSQDGDGLITALLNSPSSVARGRIKVFAQADAKLRGAIIMGIARQLAWLDDPRLRRFTSGSLEAPDFGRLRSDETSIYWCLSESDVAVLKPLSTLFFTLALYQIKQAEGSVAVNFLLDELANIGQIPNLDVEVAILRGRGVGLTLGLQSVSQLEQMYGRAAAKVILDCVNTTIVRRGLDVDSAEHVSRALGEQTHVERKRSTTKKSWAIFDVPSETTGQAKHARAVLTADELRRLGDHEQVMITTNRRPVLMRGWWWTAAKCEAEAGKCGEVLTQEFKPEEEKPKPKRREPALPTELLTALPSSGGPQ
jgi:type IV secretion system protein VirD4